MSAVGVKYISPKLSIRQRAADAVTEFCGSWTFINLVLTIERLPK
jgi:uncharacterized membrane protein